MSMLVSQTKIIP